MIGKQHKKKGSQVKRIAQQDIRLHPNPKWIAYEPITPTSASSSEAASDEVGAAAVKKRSPSSSLIVQTRERRSPSSSTEVTEIRVRSNHFGSSSPFHRGRELGECERGQQVLSTRNENQQVYIRDTTYLQTTSPNRKQSENRMPMRYLPSLELERKKRNCERISIPNLLCHESTAPHDMDDGEHHMPW